MDQDNRPVEQSREPLRLESGKRKLRVKLFIFLVCLAISGSMWVFIELMKDYTSDVHYSITFTNVPEDLILVNQEDSLITVSVNAQGFELLVAQYIRKRQTLELDLSALKIRSGPEGYTAIMPAASLIEQVGRQLSYSKAIISVKPDTLLFRFSEVYRKVVPVIPDISCTFASQYQLSDSIRVHPSYITVSSFKDVIDTLKFVTTRHMDLNNLDSNRTLMVPLHKALRNNMIRYSRDSVSLSVKVQQYTEAVLTVPVTISGNLLPLRIYPDQVEVTCLVPMAQYKDLDPASFSATVVATPGNLSLSRHLPIVLTKVPSNVRSVKLKPENVEYIIISK